MDGWMDTAMHDVGCTGPGLHIDLPQAYGLWTECDALHKWTAASQAVRGLMCRGVYFMSSSV